jgi:hypothetical protein
MDSFIERIVAATAAASPEIVAEVERLEAATAEQEKQTANLAAVIRAAIARGDSPRCDWFDPKSGPTFHNIIPDEEGHPDRREKVRVAEERIQQITRQLECPHGLTNRERGVLAGEHHRLERWVEGGMLALEENRVTDAAKQRATDKKLRWLAKKSDAGGIILKPKRNARSKKSE